MRTRHKITISSYDAIDNPFYAGGGATVVHELAKRLSKRFDVCVLTGNYKGATDTKKDGIFYKRVGFAYSNPFISQLAYNFVLPIYLFREKYDLWLESFTPPFSTSFLPLFTNKPLIGFAQMFAAEDMERKYKLPFGIVESLGLRLYSHLIVLKESDKKRVNKINRNSTVEIIPPGIDKIPTSSFYDGDYILFIGRLEFDQKGLDLLLRAYRKIHNKTEKPIVIAGSGNKRDEQLLRDTIDNLRLTSRVKLVSRVQGSQKHALFKYCSLVVIPSRYETFSMVALEAMSYGKPIVAFDIDGLSWDSSGLIRKVKPFNTGQLGKEILKTLQDKDYRRKVFTESRIHCRRFLWEKIADRHMRVVESILRHQADEKSN